jgi:hypothetical protein
MRPPPSYVLTVQSDDDCTRAIPLKDLWELLRALPGFTVGDGARSAWRDDARDLALELDAEWQGPDGKVTIATAGAPPGREAWADVNRITLRIAIAHLPDAGPAPYIAIAEAIAHPLGWKVWDAQEDRYLLPRNRRPSEPPPL